MKTSTNSNLNDRKALSDIATIFYSNRNHVKFLTIVSDNSYS